MRRCENAVTKSYVIIALVKEALSIASCNFFFIGLLRVVVLHIGVVVHEQIGVLVAVHLLLLLDVDNQHLLRVFFELQTGPLSLVVREAPTQVVTTTAIICLHLSAPLNSFLVTL